jgi:hypothetical protein
MYELAHLVVSAERQDKAAKTYEEANPEAQVWLWRHKVVFLVTGVLVLLILGGKVA